MIRRTFKTRTPRNIILNKTYQVWWSLATTSSSKYQLRLLQSYHHVNFSVKKNLERKSLITGQLKYITTPTQVFHYNVGISLHRLESIVKKRYEPKTRWQSKNLFINCYSVLTSFGALNLLIKEKTYISQTQLNTKLLHLNFTKSHYPYYNFFLQTQETYYKKHWETNKQLKIYKHYGNKRYYIYSNKEWFSRVITNRNRYFFKHSHLIYQITRIKY